MYLEFYPMKVHFSTFHAHKANFMTSNRKHIYQVKQNLVDIRTVRIRISIGDKVASDVAKVSMEAVSNMLHSILEAKAFLLDTFIGKTSSFRNQKAVERI